MVAGPDPIDAAGLAGRSCGSPFVPTVFLKMAPGLGEHAGSDHDDGHSHSATDFLAGPSLRSSSSSSSFLATDLPHGGTVAGTSAHAAVQGNAASFLFGEDGASQPPGGPTASATSFLSGGVGGIMTAQQLAQRQVQLRVAAGISATTVASSVGLFMRFVYRLAKQAQDKVAAAEAEAEKARYDSDDSDEGPDNAQSRHEADDGAGDKATTRPTFAGPRLGSLVLKPPVKVSNLSQPMPDDIGQPAYEMSAYY